MLSQDELDKLLQDGVDGGENEKEAQAGEEAVSQAGEEPGEEQPPAGAEEEGADEDLDWEAAFREAAEGGDPAAAKQLQEGTATPGPGEEAAAPEIDATEPNFSDFGREAHGAAEGTAKPDLDFILDIPLQVSVELGRAKLQIRDLLQLGRGSVVELNKMAGEPAEIYVNNKLMAKGEIVVVNEKFGVRLTEIISPADRVRSLG